MEQTASVKGSQRVPSYTRGFGINVIDTSQTSSNIESGTTKMMGSAIPISYTSNLSFSNDADSSIISQSTESSSFEEHRSVNLSGLNIISSLSTLEEMNSTATVDVSISPNTLRRTSFNKGSSPNLRRPMGKNQNILNNNHPQSPELRYKNKQLPQRFRSTPTLVSSGSPMTVDSPPIPLPRSNQSSPFIPQLNRGESHHSLRPNLRAKLSRPKSVQQLTKKQKDKIYDENDNDTFDETDDDILMYNVPIASSSSIRMFQNGNAMESRDALRKAWNESESNLIIPPSPLPGKLNDESASGVFSDGNLKASTSHINVNKSHSPERRNVANFNALSPTAQQLSNFYEFTSHNQAEEELEKRKNRNTPSTADPKLISTLDDLSLASTEKLAKLTVTRPSWIPPKDADELHRHEREFKKMISHSSKQALKHSKEQAKFEEEQKYANKRLQYFSQKSSLSSSNCFEVKRLILVTNIEKSVRFMLFRKMLNYKLGENVLLMPPFMKTANSSEDLVNQLPELDVLSFFNEEKKNLTEIEISSLKTILQPIARPIPSNCVDISKLPKIPALPIQTLLSRFARTALKLLRCDYNTAQVRDMIYWLHAHIFTSKFKESYARLLKKPSVTKLFKEFKDDYSILTIPTSLDLLLDLSDTAVCKFIELLITYWSLGDSRGAKLFVVAVICIIRDFHFGWNNLQVIFHSKAHVYIGSGDEKLQRFFGHILGYYSLV